MADERTTKDQKTTELILSKAELIVIIIGLILIIIALLFSNTMLDELVYIFYGIGTSLVATAVSLMIINESWRKLKSIRGDIKSIYYRRAYVGKYVYSDYINSAKQRIWVQGVSLNRFLSQNLDDLEIAAKRGVDIKLLLLSDTPRVSYQGHSVSFLDVSYLEEHRATQISKQESHDLVTKIDKVNLGNKDAKGYVPIQYKLYVSYCSNMVFMMDKTMFAGPYLHGIDSGEVYTLLITPGVVYDCYYNHFMNLWNDERFTTEKIYK